MNKKIRFLLFLFFLFFFLIIAPQLVLRSLGYKIDLEQKKFVKTGGLHLTIQPSPAEVFIDGKFQRKTGLFLNSVLISNLLPRKYEILVEKDDYHSWSKKIEIDEGRITKILNILLFKENPSFEIFEENTDFFLFSSSNRNIIFQKKSEERIFFEVKSLRDNSSKIFFIPREIKKILEINWHPGEETILVKIETKDDTEYFVLDLSKEEGENVIALSFLNKKIEQVVLNPEKTQEVFFLDENNLYSKNFVTDKKAVLLLEDIIYYTTHKNNIFVITNSGFLYKIDFDGKIIEALNQEPFSPVKGRYKIEITPKIVFLQIEERLFFRNSNLKTFQEIHYPIKDFLFSPANQIIFYNNNEIWLLDLDRLSGINEKEKIEKIFFSRFSEKIEDCFWLNAYYFVFDIGGKIKISETDMRDRLNIVEAAQFKSPKIYWNSFEKRLYISEENTLFVSEKLIP